MPYQNPWTTSNQWSKRPLLDICINTTSCSYMSQNISTNILNTHDLLGILNCTCPNHFWPSCSMCGLKTCCYGLYSSSSRVCQQDYVHIEIAMKSLTWGFPIQQCKHWDKLPHNERIVIHSHKTGWNKHAQQNLLIKRVELPYAWDYFTAELTKLHYKK